jgi:hypothetical protein
MSSGPKCPNHDVPLILTNTPGIGICPISTCRFEYEAVTDDEGDTPEFENVIKDGKMTRQKKRTFKITKGSEEGHNYNVRGH